VIFGARRCVGSRGNLTLAVTLPDNHGQVRVEREAVEGGNLPDKHGQVEREAELVT
jgi:hypothetical protein